MLRLAALLLVLANLGYFAWSQGHLLALGWGPASQREPERLLRQLAPEKLKLESARDTAPVPAPAPADAPPASPAPEAAAPAEATACWLASGFTPAQTQALRVVLATLPWAPNRWNLEENVLPARWIVYMGRFADSEALARKKAELRQLRVEFRDAQGLMPGLALGTYSTEAAAQQALAELGRTGVRTARVVKEREEQRSHTLRLPAVTAAERAQVEALDTALAGKKLQPC